MIMLFVDLRAVFDQIDREKVGNTNVREENKKKNNSKGERNSRKNEE